MDGQHLGQRVDAEMLGRTAHTLAHITLVTVVAVEALGLGEALESLLDASVQLTTVRLQLEGQVEEGIKRVRLGATPHALDRALQFPLEPGLHDRMLRAFFLNHRGHLAELKCEVVEQAAQELMCILLPPELDGLGKDLEIVGKKLGR